MCKSCWIERGAPISTRRDVLATAELIRRLYRDHGQSLGGPLHVMLDDMNIDDEQLDSDYYTLGRYASRATFEGSGRGWVYHDELACSPEVKDLCELILAAFRGMTEAHRAAAIAWFEGWPVDYIRQLSEQLAQGPSQLTPDAVDEFIAELQAANPPAVKTCAPVPCPPFERGHQ